MALRLRRLIGILFRNIIRFCFVHFCFFIRLIRPDHFPCNCPKAIAKGKSSGILCVIYKPVIQTFDRVLKREGVELSREDLFDFGRDECEHSSDEIPHLSDK